MATPVGGASFVKIVKIFMNQNCNLEIADGLDLFINQTCDVGGPVNININVNQICEIVGPVNININVIQDCNVVKMPLTTGNSISQICILSVIP